MGFKLLDVNKFLQNYKAKQVTNPRTFQSNFEPSSGGLLDQAIFGVSTKEKFNNWGYIMLEDVIMHPLIYKNLNVIDPIFKRIRDKTVKVIISNGMLKEDEAGGTGISWLIGNWDKINFDKYRTEKNSMFIDLVKNTSKNILFVDRIPVIPVVYREAITDSRNFRVEEDEIDKLYKKILSLSKSGRSDLTSAWMETFHDKSSKDFMQQAVNQLYEYFLKKLEKKQGFIRNLLIGKRLDNVSRLVANARPDIPIDSCIIPWHVLLNIFDMYIVGYLQQEENAQVAEELKMVNKTTQEIGELFDYIFRNSELYEKNYPKHKELWIQILVDIFNKNSDLRVLVKRDPGWNADSFWCFKPLINKDNSYQIWVSAFVYSPLGGDSFNTDFYIETKETDIIYEDDDFLIRTENEKIYVVRTLDTVWKQNG